MVNMPCTDEACEMARALPIAERIGCHLNLAEGVPLTGAMRRSGTFCGANGEFNEPLARKRLLPLSSGDKRALADETRAQISAVRRRGFAGLYLDSHRYVHTMPNVAGVVAAVAREMGVARVRPYANCGPTSWGVKGLAKALFNAWLASAGLKRVDYFGGIDDLATLAAEGDVTFASAEVMTHPVMDAGEIHDGADGALASRLAELESVLRVPIVASGAAPRYDR
jgi:predicted glycoside hydrolase/deacetylase ChbG (UPF0249 family)